MKSPFIFIFTTLCLVTCCNSCSNLTDEEIYEKGINYSKKNMHKKAIAEFSKAIEINPNLTKAYGNRGNAFRDNGNFEKAISDYNKVLQLNPIDALGYYNRGLTYHKKGDLNKAISDYTEAIQINPSLIEPYGNRGNAYQQKGDFDKAISDFTKIIETNSTDIPLYLTGSFTYIKNNRSDRLNNSQNQIAAEQINSLRTNTYYNRGNAYSAKKNFDKAISDYISALKIDPFFDKTYNAKLAENLTCAYNNKAYAFYISGENLEEGLALINKAIALSPNSGIMLGTKAELLYKMGEFEEAYQNIKKALELIPDHPELLNDLKNIENALQQKNK